MVLVLAWRLTERSLLDGHFDSAVSFRWTLCEISSVFCWAQCPSEIVLRVFGEPGAVFVGAWRLTERSLLNGHAADRRSRLDAHFGSRGRCSWACGGSQCGLI